LIPSSIAPNLISLAGLLCTIQAFYLCFSYMTTHPTLVTVASGALVFAYQTLDALDGIQARRTSNTSPVGALFDHACDNVAVVFVSLVGCYVVGVSDSITQWYVVQIFALGLLLVHLRALPRGRLRFGLLTGPGEAVFVFLVVLLAYAVFGVSYLEQLWSATVTLPLAKLLLHPSTVYYGMVVLVLVHALRLPPAHRETRLGVMFCMLFRIAPAVLYYLGWVRSESILNVVCDGLFVSVIATDLAVARMAQRQLHPWIWLFTMASVINYLAIVGVVIAFYFMLFFELTTAMKLPMFSLARNVYVDGVYDL
jgi:phosphatidylglycerophosphate synthase